MNRKPAAAAVVVMLALVPIADAAKKPPIKAPKSGQYNGHPRGRDLTLLINGKTIDIAAFSFKCGSVDGRTSLNQIPLKKGKNAYKFSLSAHGNITYTDDHPDQNGTVAIAGRFTRSGKRPAGTFRVKTPRCGGTGNIKWSAKR